MNMKTSVERAAELLREYLQDVHEVVTVGFVTFPPELRVCLRIERDTTRQRIPSRWLGLPVSVLCPMGEKHA